MANHTLNILKIENKEDFKKIVNKHIVYKEDEEKDIFDFETIIPMPKSLDVTSTSSFDYIIPYFDKKLLKEEWIKINRDKISSDILFCEALKISKEHFKKLNDKELIQLIDNNIDRISNFTSINFNLAKQYYDNLKEYGYRDWYDWRLDNWGCKWNSYELNIIEDKGIISFETPWSPPKGIFQKLIELYPNMEMNLIFLDEGYLYAGELSYSKDSGLKEIDYKEIANSEEDYNQIIENHIKSLDDIDEEELIEFGIKDIK